MVAIDGEVRSIGLRGFAEYSGARCGSDAAGKDRVQVGGVAQLSGAGPRKRGGGEERSGAGIIGIARSLAEGNGVEQRRIRRGRPRVHLGEVNAVIEEVL